MACIKISGSSTEKLFVRCYSCGRRYVWLRAYEGICGEYMALCKRCREETKIEMDKEKKKKIRRVC
jgi:hypothetical protein